MAIVNARSSVCTVITGEKLTEDEEDPKPELELAKPELLPPNPDEPPPEKPLPTAGDDVDGAAEAVVLCEERSAGSM